MCVKILCNEGFEVAFPPTRGWGLMTLDDIPQGAFVCCYAGRVYPGHLADEKAIECGDDYQAELDYIGQFLHGLK